MKTQFNDNKPPSMQQILDYADGLLNKADNKYIETFLAKSENESYQLAFESYRAFYGKEHRQELEETVSKEFSKLQEEFPIEEDPLEKEHKSWLHLLFIFFQKIKKKRYAPSLYTNLQRIYKLSLYSLGSILICLLCIPYKGILSNYFFKDTFLESHSNSKLIAGSDSGTIISLDSSLIKKPISLTKRDAVDKDGDEDCSIYNFLEYTTDPTFLTSRRWNTSTYKHKSKAPSNENLPAQTVDTIANIIRVTNKYEVKKNQEVTNNSLLIDIQENRTNFTIPLNNDTINTNEYKSGQMANRIKSTSLVKIRLGLLHKDIPQLTIKELNESIPTISSPIQPKRFNSLGIKLANNNPFAKQSVHISAGLIARFRWNNKWYSQPEISVSTTNNQLLANISDAGTISMDYRHLDYKQTQVAFELANLHYRLKPFLHIGVGTGFIVERNQKKLGEAFTPTFEDLEEGLIYTVDYTNKKRILPIAYGNIQLDIGRTGFSVGMKYYVSRDKNPYKFESTPYILENFTFKPIDSIAKLTPTGQVFLSYRFSFK